MGDLQDDGRGYTPEAGVTGGEQGHHSTGGRNVIGSSAAQAGPDIFFAAVQMSRMPMCLTDPKLPDEPIVFCNQAFEQLTGYTQADIVGHNCRFLQGERTDPATVAEIRRALDAHEDVHVELLNYRRDGSSFWNALFISPVFDTAGELVYFFASQLDVTRRREAEAMMHQSQRLETLGLMASSLAHEFNNLMTIVLANLERLEGETAAERRGRQIERAKWGAQRAARLTDQMLSFARRQFHDDRVQDVGANLAARDTILDRMAGPEVRVRLDLEPGRLLANLDASQLEMAVLNLVRNAADASRQGEEVVVSTRRRGSEVEVAVADTGSGMNAEVAKRATEPFFTTKEVGHGTGLGLSMVKGFVEQSCGRLVLDTRAGVGTTVRLLFPLVE